MFVAADLLPYHVDPPYTIVCANLPYVPSGEIAGLARELSFEPALALDGGPDGLDVVRRLLDALPRTLAPGRRRVPRDRGGARRGHRDRGRGAAPRLALPRDERPRGAAAAGPRRAGPGLTVRGGPPTRVTARAGAADPAARARHRRHHRRPRLPDLGPDRGRDPGRRRARRAGVARDRADALVGGRVCEPAGADRADHRPPGRPRPGHARPARGGHRGGARRPRPGGPDPPPRADGPGGRPRGDRVVPRQRPRPARERPRGARRVAGRPLVRGLLDVPRARAPSSCRTSSARSGGR